MKAYISNDGTLIIEGENQLERMALKGWENDFAEGRSAFRIGESEPIQRADEDVQRGRHRE